MAIGDLKDKNRPSKFYNNLNTVAEGSPALGWICTTTPVSFIPELKDASQFWVNKILKEFKDSNPDQVNWAKSFLVIFDELKKYAKEFHATGPTWNSQGGSLADNLKNINSKSSGSGAPPPPPAAPKASAGGPPPPPPPPPPASVKWTIHKRPTRTQH
ncbi:unnamed protein product [Ambrosiozyma monospora]|uniref:Unnamed protein product n=1 Tax=Ambrosiozyma monospora TaxID=43982 RepID=A0ACB5U8K0_AMBMO|nr:unnamed protein product [Ambrosiozyma monospora]